MTVKVVTDSSACLPPALAAEYGITVLDFHAEGKGDEETTAGLGALELTACYARLLERGGDDGVVAVHISKELSGTWSSASQAASVLGDTVAVLDTQSAGMVVGQAAIAAARCADEGGSLDECRGVAQQAIDSGHLWLFLGKTDAMARGGRLSTAQRLLSTALAIKPILHLAGGKIELAAKTRTQSKAMARLVTLAESAYRTAATPDPEPEKGEATEATEDAEGTSPENGDAVEPAEAAQDARDTEATEAAEAESPHAATDDDTSDDSIDSADRADSADNTDLTGEVEQPEEGRPRVFTFGGDHEFRLRKRKEAPVPLSELPAVPMHLDIHQAGCPEIAEELRATLRADLPDCVVISVVDLSPALMVHTGPEAIGITLVHG